MLLAVLIVYIVGILGGLTGVGGVLLVPALTVILGMSTHIATGTVLASFVLPAIYTTWLYAKRGAFDIQLVIPLAIGGFLCGYIGAAYKVYTSAATITLVLACMVITAGMNALSPPKPGLFNIGAASLQKRRIFLFTLGCFVGLLGGLAGSGGAVLIVPVMIFCGFPTVATISASILYSVPSGISGSIANILNGYIDWTTLAWVIVVQFFGMNTGVYLSSKVSVDMLRKIVAVICIATGIFLVVRALNM